MAPGHHYPSRRLPPPVRSVGMSPLLVFGRIVLPQVLLSTAPSIVNQFIVIVKRFILEACLLDGSHHLAFGIFGSPVGMLHREFARQPKDNMVDI